MSALTPELREFLDSKPVGVLATLADDGAALASRSCTSRVTATGC